MLKTSITKSKPQKITYRDYKNFDSVRFNGELKYVLEKEKIKSCIKFNEMFLRILNQHAPLKSKLLRANHASYISKPLRKAIMKRSYLENLYFKRRTDHSLRNYKKQKNYCSRLYTKERKNFFNKLNTSFVSDNKLFWKTVKPFFSNNGSHRGNIKLVEGDKLLQDDSEVAEELNGFFKEAVSTLDVNENSYIIDPDSINISDPIEKAISKYKFHPNTSTSDSIPPRILKITSVVSADTLHNLFNDVLKTGNFPDNLKLADIAPVFKKKNPLHKVNYRPVSVLPSISKVFEKLMQKQISGYINNYLSPYLCGYRKSFSSQQALMSLIENWKRVLDKNGFGGAVLMDLSKAFDTIKHDLLVAKLYAYGFSKESLKLLHSYLSNRWHRTKINKQFSSWQELIQSVPQGSVLGLLLFNIYLNDLFYIAESTNVCNFADDTTFYACNGDVNPLINRLEHDSYGLKTIL